MENYKEILSQNLISLRKSRKLTQLELAEKLNYSDKTISKWENGTQEASMSFVVIFADFFGVSLDYINGEEKNVPASAGTKIQSLMEMYEKLSPRNQALLESLLESMLAQQEKDE